ncbi:N-acetylglucosamine-6-phosphate deacetylase [Natroniella sulfidigena]|uniref:N-acetylglucosamine-6-phosphate deacetylase n=1 Tax=Natroniella sulfidigena TaxID=723921 RepID=UPI00200A8A0F|nr:N-acetylglucosamine-6-phosphate deacetylase [Natroniella sulfidigena]MCK8817855.1 N-acetylglucosamine-6-phosphate deacetylase [Natroniella sulfidigena]
MQAIINGKVIFPDKISEEKVIIFEDKIIDIVDQKKFDSKDLEIIDAQRNYVAPGLIDLHIHGAKGFDVMDGSMEALEEISNSIARSGVTAFLPTTMTMEFELIYQALEGIRRAMEKDLDGAKILGAHLEGPFISSKYKGAQNSKYIKKPDYELIKDYLDLIKIITYAPEEDEQFLFLNSVLENKDVVLALGHTDASYEEAAAAINRGVKHATHLFNAMSPLHHRALGVVGAVMNSEISAEIIADNIHLNKAIYDLLSKIKQNDQLVLITDAMRAACLEDGVYDLGGQKVEVKDNSARLADGTLAGSVLQMNQAVKNVYQNSDLSLNQVINFASLNPAKVINVDSERGSLEKGKYADLIMFDEDFEIVTTIIEGVVRYENY